MKVKDQKKSNYEAYKSAIQECKQLSTELKKRISKKSFVRADFSNNGLLDHESTRCNR